MHRSDARSHRTATSARTLALAAVMVLLVAGCKYLPSETTHPVPRSARLAINELLDQADAAEAGGDAEEAESRRAEAAAIECEVFGCEVPAGATTITVDPTVAGGFFDAPWPSDTRLRADGSLDLTGFPGRATLPIAELVISRAEPATFGFGTNSAVYFQASAPLDLRTVPIWAEASIGERSNVMLLDLDDPTAPPVPVLVDTKQHGTALRPANLVTVLPYPGHPLEPTTRYAAMLFDGLRDLDGNRLAPAPIIDELDGSAPGGVDPATWAKLRQDRDDAVAAIRGRTLWHPSELVAFTVFTTQDVTSEMEAVAAAVEALPEPALSSRTPATAPCTPGATSRSQGRVGLPVWQQGTRPYLDAGGSIVVGGDGLAVQQGVELSAGGQGVLVDIAVPCGPAPQAGWPILLFVDGTGGSAQAANISELGPDLPYVVLSIAPLYSGDRAVPAPPPFDDPGFQFFNYLNPVAARANQLQQAADVLFLQRVAENLTFEADEAGSGVDGRIDVDTVVHAGHSQGATTLPITLAHAPDVQGAFLSASGGGLSHSLVHRADVRALVEPFLGTEPDELDLFHPYPQLLQTFAEIGDATNYASSIDPGIDIAMYAGLRDGCTAIEVSTQFAQALGLPIATREARNPLFGPDLSDLAPLYRSPFEPGDVAVPVSQNLPGGRTGVVVQVDTGHFGATRYPAIGRSFVDSIAAGGPVVVDPGATPPVAPGTASCVRHTPVPAAP